MKRFVFAVAGLLLSGSAWAVGDALPYHFAPDTTNLPSVQRGARNFMAYCSGCHSLQYLRYNRLGADLGIPPEMLEANLIFTDAKPGDVILSAMPKEPAAGWFGQVPPDLTLETRARGASWVYSYLRTFYVDDTRPLGVNNLVLPGASMPHVLSELQGWQVLEQAPAAGEHAQEGGHAEGPPLKLVVPGSLTPEEYEAFVADTVNFLTYAAEPGKAHRVAVGWNAMVYLFVLLVLAYLLKKEFWRDVHDAPAKDKLP